jgi:transaldolase / glucose-6-phosphate isomerase
MANPLVRLIDFGQSFWLDNIRRGFTRSGELKRLVDDDGLRGVTSNPTIFEKAVAGGNDYDAAIKELVGAGKSPQEMFDVLTTDDIREACDVFRELYDASKGGDGYVSLELPPYLARTTEGSITEALRLWKTVDRPNVMIKVPATDEGMPVIRRLIAEGLNVNITLMFGEGYYENVIDAYMSGLEDRHRKGLPLHHIASVASCFVSRVDTEADRRIEAALPNADALRQKRFEAVQGKTAIANSKRLYQLYQKSIASERWLALAATGARRQRPLWASTSTKNPKYKDTYYVEALIGPDTVDTMPPATIDAFRDHGIVAPTLEQDMGSADAIIRELEALGISLKDITDKLLADGIASFEKSYADLLDVLSKKADEFQSPIDRQSIDGIDAATHAAALAKLDAQRFVARVWQHDPDLWKKGDAQHAAIIRDRLGWLASPDLMYHRTQEIDAFVESVRNDRLTHVVVMGMGGSSLCPIVLRETFGVRSGYPDVLVLDSTVPASVLEVESKIDVAKTMFIESSKSGGTLESRSFSEYFFVKATAALGSAKAAADRFACITDPGTSLEKLARERGFRKIFLNPEDIGGRYSALSFFGLVPAACVGVDIGSLLDRARCMVQACAAGVAASANPGVALGVALAGLATGKGRDKVTILASPGIATFGLWLEQLIAESLGKEGRGLIPISQEPPGDPAAYGSDRVFVHLRLADDASFDERGEALIRAGHPLVRIRLRDRLDLGEEFFRWELATATVGAMIGVDAFDQPNVQESKDNTSRILAQANGGALPAAPSAAPQDAGALDAFLRGLKPGDYIALMAFVHETAQREDALQIVRATLRDATRAATTFGYGPRFLHSTGQLHKGGPNSGVFIQLVGREGPRLPIPGQPFDFGTLVAAQSLGDFQSLQAHGRRVMRVDLGDDVDAGIAAFGRAVEGFAGSKSGVPH